MDSNGKCVGLLDIAKCLYDAVTRLGKAAKKKAAESEAGGDDDGSGSTVMIGAVMEAAKALKGKASAKSQRALQVPPPLLLLFITVVVFVNVGERYKTALARAMATAAVVFKRYIACCVIGAVRCLHVGDRHFVVC